METGGLASRFSQALEKVAHYSPLNQGLSLFEHWLDLVNTVQGARDAVVGPTPKEVIWRKNKARLYRYERTTPATRKTPVLCIMPLINRAYILDLRPGASFVAYLLSQGHDIYLLDCGEWNDDDRSLNLDVLIEQYMARAVRMVARRAGGPLTLLGYCIGGAVATCFSALHTEGLIKNLVLLTTPIDFADA